MIKLVLNLKKNSSFRMLYLVSNLKLGFRMVNFISMLNKFGTRYIYRRVMRKVAWINYSFPPGAWAVACGGWYCGPTSHVPSFLSPPALASQWLALCSLSPKPYEKEKPKYSSLSLSSRSSNTLVHLLHPAPVPVQFIISLYWGLYDHRSHVQHRRRQFHRPPAATYVD